MDLKWPRVARRSNVGLVQHWDSAIEILTHGQIHLSCIVNAMVTDGLVTQGPRASADRLKHRGFVVPFDNIGSGNGLLPDGTKPLPDPMLTYCQSAY